MVRPHIRITLICYTMGTRRQGDKEKREQGIAISSPDLDPTDAFEVALADFLALA